jgi:hypothetical protein
MLWVYFGVVEWSLGFDESVARGLMAVDGRNDWL